MWYNSGMKKLLAFLPLFLTGCALFDGIRYPMPDAAYNVAKGDKVAHFKMTDESIEGAYSRFYRLYDVLSDRFGEVKIGRRKEGQKFFSPDLFARWKQTDEHLGVDLYVEDWSKHPDPRMRDGGIILDVYMRDFRKQDAKTKERLRKHYGEEGMKKHLDKSGNLLY